MDCVLFFLNIYLVITWYILTLYSFIGSGFYKSMFCQVSGKQILDLCAWKTGNAGLVAVYWEQYILHIQYFLQEQYILRI